MCFSVIIPTYNEENIIRKQIQRIRSTLNAEIIVVDGGSTDHTKEILEEEDVLLIPSRKGRGTQCAEGVNHASNDLLIFLHADTRLPTDASNKLSEFFMDEKKKIGAFTIKFEPKNLILDLLTIASRFDSILTSFGDQCIFLRKNFYEEIGGFPDWPLFEDVYLFQKARKITKVHPKGRSDMPLLGVFATRSPDRPNPIGLTLVELLKIEKNILTVHGLDALNGTPILDIKPFDYRDMTQDARVPDWWVRLEKSRKRNLKVI